MLRFAWLEEKLLTSEDWLHSLELVDNINMATVRNCEMETQYRAIRPFCVLFSVAENILLLRREGW